MFNAVFFSYAIFVLFFISLLLFLRPLVCLPFFLIFEIIGVCTMASQLSKEYLTGRRRVKAQFTLFFVDLTFSARQNMHDLGVIIR